MNHGFQIIHSADGGIGRFILGFKENLVNIALHGGRPVNRSESDAQTAACHKILRQSRLRQNILGHLAGVIGHRSHGLSVRPGKIVGDRIIDRSINPGMNEAADQLVFAQRLNTGNALGQALDNLRLAVSDR